MRILPVLAVMLTAAGPLAAAETVVKPTITVTGEGRADTAPDMATVMVGVTTEADTAKEAMDANNALLSATLAGLKSAGIEPRDIQTTGLSLGPRYDYNRQKPDGTALITGFTAMNGVNVRVRALETLGTVLDAVVSDGANTLGGVSFGLQNPEPVLDAARKSAVADARRKAELYAAAAGVTLGPIMSITEQSGYAPPMPMAYADAGMKEAAAVPVQAGQVSLMSNVTIVWEIAQ